MKNSPHHIKKTQRKAVHQSQKEEYQTEEKVLKEKTIKRNVTSKKTNKIARGKAAAKKKSHMSSPDDVTWETEPESTHREGSRWIQTVQRQTMDAANRLRKKLQKFNFLKKKK